MKTIKVLSLIALFGWIMSLTGCSPWYLKYGIENKAEIKNASAVPKLVEALEDPDPHIRQKALRCIGTSIHTDDATMKAVEKIARKDSWEKNRYYAIRVMRAISREKLTTTAEIADILTSEKNRTVHVIANRIINEELDFEYFRIPIPISDNGKATAEFIGVSVSPIFTFDQGFKAKYNIQEFGVLPLYIEIDNRSSLPLVLDAEEVDLFPLIETPLDKILPTQETDNKLFQKHQKQFLSRLSLQPGEKGSGYIYYNISCNFSHIFNWTLTIPVQIGQNSSHKINYSFGNPASLDGQPLHFPREVSDVNNALVSEDTYRVIQQLQSNQIQMQIDAAKIVYRLKEIHPYLYKIAAQELRAGYKTLEYGIQSVEAMLWLTRVLALSHDMQYEPLLREVKETTPDYNLSQHAQRALSKL